MYLVLIKKRAETICYEAKKILAENSEITEADKTKIQGLVSDLEAAIAKEDLATMKDLMAQYISMQTASAGAEGSPNAAKGDAIDTDFSAEK